MRNSYANESRKYKILNHTKWSMGNDVELKTRLIVIEFTPKYEHRNFAVRMQTNDGATYGGDSFETYEGAHNAFLRKYLDHNASYRKGNPSHYPGIVK
jgi:hypothetical protein